jgi:hypothetical protein
MKPKEPSTKEFWVYMNQYEPKLKRSLMSPMKSFMVDVGNVIKHIQSKGDGFLLQRLIKN